MHMTQFSQRDPRWSEIKIGKSTSTLGRYGCLITCLGAVCDLEPDDTNDLFTKNGVYDKDLVLWSKVPSALPLKLVKLPTNYDNAKVVETIQKYGFCIVEVDLDGVIASSDDKHWVVFTGNKQLIDPWDGAIKATSNYPVLKRYVVFEKTNPLPATPPVVTPEPTIDPDRVKMDLGPEWGIMEVQAIRSSLNDMKKAVADGNIERSGLQAQVKDLIESRQKLAQMLGCPDDFSAIVSEVQKLIDTEDQHNGGDVVAPGLIQWFISLFKGKR